MLKRTFLFSLIALVAIATVGCLTKQQCMTKYGLVEEPARTGGDPVIGAPPGPIITLKPPTSGSTELIWKVDSTEQTPSSVSIFDDCRIRYDFIGIRALKFNYRLTSASAWQPAQHIRASNDDIQIDIKLVDGPLLTKVVHFTVIKKGENPPVFCGGPVPVSPHPANELPPEFFDLLSEELKEIKSDLEIHSFQFQIDPEAPPS